MFKWINLYKSFPIHTKPMWEFGPCITEMKEMAWVYLLLTCNRRVWKHYQSSFSTAWLWGKKSIYCWQNPFSQVKKGLWWDIFKWFSQNNKQAGLRTNTRWRKTQQKQRHQCGRCSLRNKAVSNACREKPENGPLLPSHCLMWFW